jgi:DUF4097 and DUF4098 domain-containing protein YvlB
MILALLVGSVHAASAQRTLGVSVEQDVGEIRELRIAIPATEIRIVPGPAGEITVTGTMPMSTWEFWQGGGWIRSPEEGAYVLQLLAYSPSERPSGRLEIAVPSVVRLIVGRGQNVRVSSRVTELVSISSSPSNLVMERGTGTRHVEIDSFGGTVELRTPELQTARVNGLETSVMLIADRPKALEITTMTGNLNIHIDNLVTGVHQFATTSGSIDFHVDEAIDATLMLQTVEGRLAPPETGPIEVQTAELIYEGANARVNIRTFSGDIRTRVTTGQEYRLPHESN